MDRLATLIHENPILYIPFALVASSFLLVGGMFVFMFCMIGEVVDYFDCAKRIFGAILVVAISVFFIVFGSVGCASMERSNLLDRCERECRVKGFVPVSMTSSIDGDAFEFKCECQGVKK